MFIFGLPESERIDCMGKSLKGKELGKGISQRKDGLYQARFVNRFGKRSAIYDKTYSGITKKLREAQYADEKNENVIDKNITLNEWFDIWIETYKKIAELIQYKLTLYTIIV